MTSRHSSKTTVQSFFCHGYLGTACSAHGPLYWNPPIVPKNMSHFLFEAVVRVSVRRLVYDQKDCPLRYKTPADSAPWTELRKYRTIVRMARPPDYLEFDALLLYSNYDMNSFTCRD